LLDEEQKAIIQTAYSELREAKGFRGRLCQRQMIATIAKTLGGIEDGGPNTCTIEAGTGTGKTVAYILAALPIARALNKKLVVSTATIALQEQIVFTDLPDILKHANLDFTFVLAKGRRRYLCLSKLDKLLRETGSRNLSLALYDDEVAADVPDPELYQRMLDRAGMGEWNGERESWPQELDDAAWNPVSTDHVQCTGRKCSNYDNCFFYRARERVFKVDCVVTNHDMVLSDAVMGGGTVLPPPDESIYVFDEAHHLPAKAVNHLSHFVNLRGSQSWLEEIPGSLTQMLAQIGPVGNIEHRLPSIDDRVHSLTAQLSGVGELLDRLRMTEVVAPDGTLRFPLGRVDDELRMHAGRLAEGLSLLLRDVSPVADDLNLQLEDAEPNARDDLEGWLAVLGGIRSQLENSQVLWSDFAVADQTEDDGAGYPRARWITYRGDPVSDTRVSCSPISVKDALKELLWDTCHGAILTSATIAVGGDFSLFRERSGVAADSVFETLTSPFRYPEQAVMRIPKMDVDPRNGQAFTDRVGEMLPGLVQDSRGVLVLFTAWRQMHQVEELLPEAFLEKVLAQGALPKSELILRHKSAVDAGQQSVIFGQASFAEGIDLPGEYCDHVVIVKIPFSVPDDPVGATLAEWIEAQGRNAFREISVPEAVLRLVQASGRLLRTETDTGVITMLDRRLVTERYGHMILNSLPPFRREIER
jgi:ATP-dependent DNA helicase DinG